MNFAESLLRASVAAVRIPVSIAADAVTMGGHLTDRREPYTQTAVRDLMQNIEDAARPIEKEADE